jgi:hypothetical protein
MRNSRCLLRVSEGNLLFYPGINWDAAFNIALRPVSMPRGIVVVYKAARQPRRVVLVARIAPWARHAAAATCARVHAFPRTIRMVFANPALVIAAEASHQRRIPSAAWAAQICPR